MRIHLIGPDGPDQMSTKWLLEERGYSVTCTTDLVMEQHGPQDGPGFRREQMLAMLYCDAVVLEEELLDDATAVMRILHVCRFAGRPVLRYDELPVQAPSTLRRPDIIAERDLLQPPAEPVGKRLRAQLKGALLRVEAWGRRFDDRWGWFFTNGNKAATHQPAQA